MKVKANAEFEKLFPKIQPCRVEIETTDGKVYERRIDVPKGDPRDPMTPEELAVKFDALSAARSRTSGRRRSARRSSRWRSWRRVDELMRLCVADIR